MTTNIAIIGAGCAGLGAATAFFEQKADVMVTLIDANNWLGGRARTSTVPGLPIDLGPQFIQDPRVNPWTEIMRSLPEYKKLKIPETPVGTLYRVRVAEDRWQSMIDNKGILATNSRLFEQHDEAAKLKNCPILTGNAPEFCKGQQDIRLSLGSCYLGSIGESVEPWQYVVSDQERQAAVENGGDNIYVPGGLGNLVQTYGQSLLAANWKRLSFRNDKVGSIDGSTSKKVTLGLSKGMAEFDFCIVTVPVGEIANIEFFPPLPEEQATAYDFVRLGSYKKVAFRPTAFPGQEADTIRTKCEYYLYDEDRDGVWQYFRLPTDECILICVASGDFARALDAEPDDKVAAAIFTLLGKAHPGGNFDPRENAVVVTNWTEAANVHGAYSYTRYDSALGPDDPVPFNARPMLARPLGPIHFAGEATWTEAYGTIHGAYHSGRRAAGEILKLIS